MTGKYFNKAVFVSLMVTVLFLISAPVAMAAGDQTDLYYRVQAGDSLWLIGWRFETTPAAIKSLNGLKSDVVFTGQILRIPRSTGPVREIPKSVDYVVKQGDSLYIIGQKFGVAASAVQEANRLDSAVIYTGQKIVVPLPPQTRYTVQNGDTLFLIARRFNANIDALSLVNRINSSGLWTGQVLFVPDNSSPPAVPKPPNTQAPPDASPSPPAGNPPPDDSIQPEDGPKQPPVQEVPPGSGSGGQESPPNPEGGQWGAAPPGVVLYRVAPGENLWILAKRFQTTIAAIMTTNHLHTDLIQVNQPLFIPQNSDKPVVIPYPSGPRREGFGELLDWEYASWVLDTYNTATLQDLETGRTFRVRRLGGSNHADMEPITAADTAVMKEIFGGEWSWNRRAVLVHVDGKVIAASMAGMPHSIQTITDNNFPGHFDLHFFNSRTHNTNTIDPEHQAMVRKAAGN